MKRIIALALSALMLCAALTSCGGRTKIDLTNVNSLAQLSGTGAHIAAQTNTFHLDALNAQVTGVNITDYDSFSLLLNALTVGTIDAYVAEEPTAWAVCGENDSITYIPLVNNTTGFSATDADVGIAVAFKTGSAYVATVNEIIAGIDAQTRETLMRQMVTLSADPDTQSDAPIAITVNTPAETNGVLKIAMECDYKPYNWMQTTDANDAVKIANASGYANGYDVQIARYIAAALGMQLEIHAYGWDSLIPAVQSGAIDGIVAGMSPTAEREEEVDFTDCYWSSNLVLIIKKGQ